MLGRRDHWGNANETKKSRPAGRRQMGRDEYLWETVSETGAIHLITEGMGTQPFHEGIKEHWGQDVTCCGGPPYTKGQGAELQCPSTSFQNLSSGYNWYHSWRLSSNSSLDRLTDRNHDWWYQKWLKGPGVSIELYPSHSPNHPRGWPRLFQSHKQVWNEIRRDLNDLPHPGRLIWPQPVQSPCSRVEHLRLISKYWYLLDQG